MQEQIFKEAQKHWSRAQRLNFILEDLENASSDVRTNFRIDIAAGGQTVHIPEEDYEHVYDALVDYFTEARKKAQADLAIL